MLDQPGRRGASTRTRGPALDFQQHLATLEKAGGTITQVLATGQAWLIVYQGGTKPKAAAAAKKVEVR